ncbi:MAG: DUF2798 domain-containing protein [Rhodobacteraceae bacterium]|nr:DUF2798 domain-containing protein [Paracoccaceae bacterium]
MIPQKYGQLLFGLVLSAIMTFAVSGISTWRIVGLSHEFFGRWMNAWLPSFMVAFPLVLVAAPTSKWLVSKVLIPNDPET